MDSIELLACMGCQRVVDQFTFPERCPRCNSRFHKQVAPSRFIIMRWFLSQPKHVVSLFIQDIREKYHVYKSRS